MSEIKLAIIGFPLKRTLSPLIYKIIFEKFNLKVEYKILRFDKRKLTSFLKKLFNFTNSLDGLNITAPYKTLICDFPFIKSREARKIKSANTLKIEGNKFYSFNTDIYGFERFLRVKGIIAKNKDIMIFGTGGVARAILYALKNKGFKRIFLISRNKNKAKKLIKDLKIKNKKIIPSDYKEIEKCDIYINCSSSANKKFRNFKFNSKALFIDLNYSASLTPFLRYAKKFKAKNIFDGKEILFYQALKNFEIWTKKRIDEKTENILKKEFLGRIK
jgi:shikimate dehydrogenase